MSIRAKAMLYTAAYIGGAFAIGAVIMLIVEYFSMLVAVSAFAVFIFGYLAKTVYEMKYDEFLREENK